MSTWRFPIWRLMVAVATVGCATGAAVAFSADADGGRVLVGWASLYGALATLALARGIPPGMAARRAGEIVRRGLPFVAIFGLISGAMSGEVGLIGGSAAAALLTGLVALAATALMSHE
jgi:uncharacterized membrane protein YfcA